ncbi:MAG: hypothetical protein ACI379_17060 [Nocardioides sp.]
MTDTWGTRERGVRQRQRQDVAEDELGERFVPENSEEDLAAVLAALAKLD